MVRYIYCISLKISVWKALRKSYSSIPGTMQYSIWSESNGNVSSGGICQLPSLDCLYNANWVEMYWAEPKGAIAIRLVTTAKPFGAIIESINNLFKYIAKSVVNSFSPFAKCRFFHSENMIFQIATKKNFLRKLTVNIADEKIYYN